MFFKVIVRVLAILVILVPSTASAAIPEWVRDLSRHDELAVFPFDHQPEITCLALIVYYEARGEQLRGQRAVAEVVMNRTRSPRYPSTVCEVMFQHRQFSFVRGRERELTPRSGPVWDRAVQVATEVYNQPTTSNRWLSFCNCGKSGFRIGNHVFYGG